MNSIFSRCLLSNTYFIKTIKPFKVQFKFQLQHRALPRPLYPDSVLIFSKLVQDIESMTPFCFICNQVCCYCCLISDPLNKNGHCLRGRAMGWGRRLCLCPSLWLVIVQNIQYTLDMCKLYAWELTESKLYWVKDNLQKATQSMGQASINIHILYSMSLLNVSWHGRILVL